MNTLFGNWLITLGPLQVAKAGLVPVLVALLVQLPTHRRAEVQDQAACLLLEAAASNNGMVQKLSHVSIETADMFTTLMKLDTLKFCFRYCRRSFCTSTV